MSTRDDSTIRFEGEHPDELLAEYVDGPIDPADRAAVEAHLAGCETCRADVAAARRARDALVALPDLHVPVGLTRSVVDAARGWGSRRNPAVWMWASGAAAAAALIGLFVFIGLNGGDGRDSAAESPHALEAGPTTGAPGVMATTAPPSQDIPIVKLAVDLDQEGLQALAGDEAGKASPMFGTEDTAGGDDGDTEADASGPLAAPGRNAARAQRAYECILQGADLDPAAVLIEIIDTRFQGTPAWIGVFSLGDSPGAPADRVELWVVAKADCTTFLSYAEDRL